MLKTSLKTKHKGVNESNFIFLSYSEVDFSKKGKKLQETFIKILLIKF